LAPPEPETKEKKGYYFGGKKGEVSGPKEGGLVKAGKNVFKQKGGSL